MTDNGNTDKNKLTIDERLKFLLESTESLHDLMVKFLAEMVQVRAEREQTHLRFARQDAADRRHRRAILAAMQGYLAALDADRGAE